MDWQIPLIIYLLVSLFLGEGLIHFYKKKGQRVPPAEYAIILLIWPLCILVMIMNMRRK